ncbi:MAG: aldehyde dehydrogenase family protein [Candidatus Eremiobacteraeota bacterium]|nr:aldehyde dehydrogenase family protein [Candidatus Eremiobacteraeota bacterium]
MDTQRSFVERLVRVREAAGRWASLSLARKIELLCACRDATGRVAGAWTACAAALKGVSRTPAAGEEAITGPWAVMATLNRYVLTLREIERFGAPRFERRATRVRPDGRTVARVFPEGGYDRLLLPGVRGEVWTRDSTLSTLPADSRPTVTLVLGAGNVTSIGPLDALYAIVAEGSACVLKLHPLLDDLAPTVREALAPLIAEGALTLERGDAAVGRRLVADPLVDRVHVTGSFATYESILAEAGPRKRVTGELGNVTPTIVVPDRWSDADFAAAATNIASAKLHNGGFNCVAPQVLILPRRWAGRSTLLGHLERRLREAPARPAYYPGAAERFARLLGGRVPRAVVEVAYEDVCEPLFREEAFCALLAAVALPGDDAESYLTNAVSFVNERLAGDLAVNLIVRSPARCGGALDNAVAELRYGCVSVNAWSGVAFMLPQLPWGAYRGEDRKPRGSGCGVVHNSRLLAQTQKCALYAPFSPFPKPPWYLTNRNRAAIGAALCDFELTRSAAAFAKVALLAVTG